MTTVQCTISGTQPQLVSASKIKFNSFIAFGYTGHSIPSGIPAPNSGIVYLGFESGRYPLQIGTGSYINFALANKTYDNLTNLWIRGNVGDGVYIVTYK